MISPALAKVVSSTELHKVETGFANTLLTYLHMTGPGDGIPAENLYVSMLHQLDAAQLVLRRCTNSR